jgi:PadR family transcriptional regulator PadR
MTPYGCPRGGRLGRGPHLRRFMEPCLLFLLLRGASHGYDLAQGIEGLGLPGVDPSLVYRLLRAFEEEGLVLSAWDTEATAGPARRVYCLTERGNDVLSAWVAELQETDRVLHGFLEAYEAHATAQDGRSDSSTTPRAIGRG